jgi:peroxiredoxin
LGLKTQGMIPRTAAARAPLLLFASLLGVFTAALPAAALSIGESASGELVAPQALTASRLSAEWTLSLPAGTHVLVELSSDAFDPLLRVAMPDGGTLEDDDSAGDLNARLLLRSAEGGEAQVTVTSYGVGAAGPYTLSAESLEAQPLAAGAPHTDSFLRGAKIFRLPVEAAETLLIDLTSGDFDPVLSTLGPDGVALTDDDSGERYDAQLIYTPRARGDLELTVMPYSGPGGGFTLTAVPLGHAPGIDVGAAPISPEGASREITVDPAAGWVAADLRGAPGRRLVVEASSDQFDPVLTARAPGGWTKVDDDSGVGDTARLGIEMPAAGEVALIIRAYDLRTGGKGAVRVMEAPSPTIPDFTLRDLRGRDISPSDFEGQVRIIDVWATWCEGCVEEIPELIELAREYQGRVALIGLSVDDTPSVVRTFAQDMRINYPIAMATPEVIGLLGRLAPHWDLDTYPATFVFDRQGRLDAVHVGLTEKKVFVQEIERLLAEDRASSGTN